MRDDVGTDRRSRGPGWRFSEPTLSRDPAGSPGVYATATRERSSDRLARSGDSYGAKEKPSRSLLLRAGSDRAQGQCGRFCFWIGAGVCSLRTETPLSTRRRERPCSRDGTVPQVVSEHQGWGIGDVRWTQGLKGFTLLTVQLEDPDRLTHFEEGPCGLHLHPPAGFKVDKLSAVEAVDALLCSHRRSD